MIGAAGDGGVDRVFHVAGITSMRPADRERVFEVNVDANVIEEARGVGVQRVVHTSSVGAISAKPNESADETQPDFTGGRLGISRTSTRSTKPSRRRCAMRSRGWTS